MLATVVLLSFGCQTAGHFAIDHTIGAKIGPCGRAQDSVRRELGEPYRKIVGDEEDVSDRVKRFEHEWAYRLLDVSADTVIARLDSVDVVRFRWESEATYCDVDQRRARQIKTPFGMSWEESSSD